MTVDLVLQSGVINKILGYEKSKETSDQSITERYCFDKPNPDIENVQKISECVVYEISQMEKLEEMLST